MRAFHGFLLVIALSGACTPEAIEVDAAAGSAGTSTPTAGTTAASGGAAGSATSGGQGGAINVGTGGIAGSAGNISLGGIGGSLAGGAGNAGAGQAGMGPMCATLTSPRPECVPCLQSNCAPQISDCKDNDCACRKWNGSTGQMNCLLACPTLSPKQTDAEGCAASCGFGTLGQADPRTRALFECLVNAPSGPPRCAKCYAAPP